MSDFALSDLKRVYWPATGKIAVARGFASGLVFAVINLFMLPTYDASTIGGLLFFPIAMAVFAIPLGLFCNLCGRVAGAFIPLMGAFFNIIGSLIVCLGDPLVYFLNRKFPALFDVADFKFFNFTPLLFITHPE
jgi:hypothetical protein